MNVYSLWNGPCPGLKQPKSTMISWQQQIWLTQRLYYRFCVQGAAFLFDYLSCKLLPGPLEEFWKKSQHRYKITNWAVKQSGDASLPNDVHTSRCEGLQINSTLRQYKEKICLILPLLNMYWMEVDLSLFEQRTNSRELAGFTFSLLVSSQILRGRGFGVVWVSHLGHLT